MNATRILITNCHAMHTLTEHNKGSAAVVISTIKILERFVPHAEFTTFFQLSEGLANECHVRVVRGKLFSSKNFSLGTMLNSSSNLLRCALWAMVDRYLSALRPIAKRLINSRELREYANADIVVDLSMDLYSDDFGSLSVIEHSKDILLSVLLKKPVVIWAQSLGPFRSGLTSWLVRLALNRVALITVREEISANTLQELGINVPPSYVTADPAFLLEPAPEERAEEILSKQGIDTSHRPIVGVTMSWSVLITQAKTSIYLQLMRSAYRMIRDLFPEKLFNAVLTRMSRFKRLDMSKYLDVEVMTQMVNYLVEELNATVVLIPHDVSPSLDDRIIGREILQRARQGNRVRLIDGDHSAQELKAIIGQCDLFIGGKMHANIAALSMHVPTVGIQYGHKFRGIMSLLKQEEYVCDKLSLEGLISRIDRAWANKEQIRAELKANINMVKERSLYNGKLVSSLLKFPKASA